MALRTPTVPRQASRTGSTLAVSDESTGLARRVPLGRLQETEEPAPVEAVPPAPRITVNGVACRRLQIDFGSNGATGFCPSNGSTSSVMERFWDQYDGDPDKDKYSRPRPFGNAHIEVNTNKGYLDLLASWDNAPGITRIVQSAAYLNYEPL